MTPLLCFAYWIPKIEANIARDRRITRELRALGWFVVRVWETDVTRDSGTAARKIVDSIDQQTSKA